VLVIGCGPIGALAVAVAKCFGATEIVAVDLHDKPLEIATAVGATRTLKATDTKEIAAVDADVVIESSGNHRGLASAIAGATRGGTVVMVGLFRFNTEIDDVIPAIADGTLAIAPIVTHVFPVTETLEAFSTAVDASVSGKVLLAF
jgi:L-idonate 5-dehydrogenase